MKPLHWSALRHMGESPAHYRHYLEVGLVQTPAMRFGSLVHAIALGKTSRGFVVYEGQRRGNAWKEAKEQYAGKEIVTREEFEKASECADAIKFDPIAGPLMREGYREHKMEWSIGDRPCAGTPDLNGSLLVDLKVSAVTNPLRFPWHAYRMGWHGQLAWYFNGLRENGSDVEACKIIAVLPKAPWCPVVYSLTTDALLAGERYWRSLLQRLEVCEESNEWPGYAQQQVPLDVPDEPLELEVGGESLVM